MFPVNLADAGSKEVLGEIGLEIVRSYFMRGMYVQATEYARNALAESLHRTLRNLRAKEANRRRHLPVPSSSAIISPVSPQQARDDVDARRHLSSEHPRCLDGVAYEQGALHVQHLQLPCILIHSGACDDVCSCRQI